MYVLSTLVPIVPKQMHYLEWCLQSYMFILFAPVICIYHKSEYL